MTEGLAIPPGALTPDEYIARVEGAVSWLKTQVRVGGGSRFEQYLKALKLERDGLAKDQTIVAQAITEGHELVRIHDAFEGCTEHSFIEKLKQIPAGRVLPFDDTGASHPRNFQFELFIAAELHQKGLPVRFEEPDVIVEADGCAVGIAGKRPRKRERIRERVREAVDQLAGRSDVTHGVIALDVGLLILDRPGAVLLNGMPTGSVIAPKVHALASSLLAGNELEPALREDDPRLSWNIWLYAKVPCVEQTMGGLMFSGCNHMLSRGSSSDDAIAPIRKRLRDLQ